MATLSTEREIIAPVDLCDAKGRLHPDARGWARQPMLRANLRGRHGRKKRWDYWCIDTPELVVSCVYADVDYVGLANVWVMERSSGRQATAGVLKPLARGFAMPEQVCTGTVTYEDDTFRLRIEETPGITRIVVWAKSSGSSAWPGEIHVDVEVAKPQGHESLNVVIPWSDRKFQFTSKQNSRPAVGSVQVGEQRWTVSDDAWGVQDLGRGVWPYSNRWNWASASGQAQDGRLVGLQFGGKWTEGTGATENALCIDGRLTKISEELVWTYDWANPMTPWHVRAAESNRVDMTLTPTFDRYDVTDLKVLKMEVHQCFGTWSGRIVGDDGVPAVLDGIRGFAEEARNRW
ncbi:MAG: hypothetical protein RJA49_495 [Actinomycetota bacterium]